MTTDMINGTFEFLGSFAVGLSIYKVVRDKGYAGLSLWNVAFFSLWGVWNVYYYPSINQWWSFVGGCALSLTNLTYVCCLIWFGHQKE